MAAGGPGGNAAFLQGLQQLGWTVGQNLRIDYRWSGGSEDETRKYAAELVALAPDVIFGPGSATAGPLRRATRTVPIVFTNVADPVGAGLVESLARPGGNMTGFTPFEYGIGAKWLQLLKEIAPNVTRAAVLRDPTISAGLGLWAAIQSVSPVVAIEVSPVNVGDPGEIEHSLAAFARSPNGGLIMTASALAVVHRDLTIALAARHRLPAVYYDRYFAVAGGLISYGPNTVGEFRRAADYVDRILKGEKPADSGSDEIRFGDQREDRQRARHRNSADTARPRRRGDRMKCALYACVASGGRSHPESCRLLR